MGIFSDTLEDNAERVGQLLAPTAPSDPRPMRRKDVTAPPVWHMCPECAAPFIDLNLLADHLRKRCRGRHLYVKLNGQIVRDIAWAPEGVESLELVQLGGVDAEASVSTSHGESKIALKRSASLERYVSREYDGVVEIRVRGAHNRTSSFRIYVGSPPQFSRPDLDELVRTLVFESLQGGQDPDLAHWRRKTNVSVDDSLGERFVNGAFEYTLGMRLEGRGDKLSKDHLEAAFGQLLPFETPLATSLRSALALKMNCFDVLRRRKGHSPFAAANWLFGNSSLPNPVLAPDGVAIQVAADDATVHILDACRLFAAGDLENVAETLHSLDKLAYPLTKNDQDKAGYIRARLHSAIAATAYTALKFHPVFGPEASRWLQATGVEA